MKFVSTRKKSTTDQLSDAIVQGLAEDGGLFVPEKFPKIDSRISSFDPSNYSSSAEQVLRPYFVGDRLENELSSICKEAFSFDLTLSPLNKKLSLLELYHGPTAAFKDFGARFLSACLKRLTSDQKKVILVATSGDTGGAVASAFENNPNVDVFVLFPKGMVSPFQERQLTCWGNNIRAFEIEGTFDDCQALVKAAFADRELNQAIELSSANSINIGRLLPQMMYYALISLDYQNKQGCDPGFIVPSGNLGNAIGCFWAMQMGCPIRAIHLATNSNRPLVDFFESGKFEPRPSHSTLANAMDVGRPSNFERLQDLFPDRQPLLEIASASSCTDQEILLGMRQAQIDWHRVICPHTATATQAWNHHLDQELDWIAVATAHPAKFMEVVQQALGQDAEMPANLLAILDRPVQKTTLPNSLSALIEKILEEN